MAGCNAHANRVAPIVTWMVGASSHTAGPRGIYCVTGAFPADHHFLATARQAELPRFRTLPFFASRRRGRKGLRFPARSSCPTMFFVAWARGRLGKGNVCALPNNQLTGHLHIFPAGIVSSNSVHFPRIFFKHMTLEDMFSLILGPHKFAAASGSLDVAHFHAFLTLSGTSLLATLTL